MSVVEDFIAIAKKEIGYVETGVNITKYNEWADEESVWFAKVQGCSWCTTFIAWCIKELAAKYLIKVDDFYCDNKCCWSDHWMDNFKNACRFYYSPQIGDFAFRKGHIGIVSAIEPYGVVTTIEGNSNDRVEEIRHVTSYWLGFGRPLWTLIRPRLGYNSETTSAKEFVINQGIYIGRNDGEMHWEDNLTREEMALILYRYWKKFNK